MEKRIGFECDFVFYFYFIFSLFLLYLTSRGIGTVDQCSCRRADDKDRIPLILKSKFEVAGRIVI